MEARIVCVAWLASAALMLQAQTGKGTYRRTFTIPAEWEGRDVYVRFNSVGHGYYLWTVRHGARR